jgi:hypothetical protein
MQHRDSLLAEALHYRSGAIPVFVLHPGHDAGAALVVHEIWLHIKLLTTPRCGVLFFDRAEGCATRQIMLCYLVMAPPNRGECYEDPTP